MPATGESIKAEFGKIPVFADKSANAGDKLWCKLAKKVSLFLGDGNQVKKFLLLLENEMREELKRKVNESAAKEHAPLGVYAKEIARSGKGKLPSVKKLLSDVLRKEEGINGFRHAVDHAKIGSTAEKDGTQPQLIFKVLGTLEFREMLKHRRPFKDPFVNGYHGEYSHRIQLWCVMKYVKSGDVSIQRPSVNGSIADFQGWVAEQNPETDSTKAFDTRGLWDALFDRRAFKGTDQAVHYETVADDDLRSPENLFKFITEKHIGELVLLGNFLKGRLDRRHSTDPDEVQNYAALKRFGKRYPSLSESEKAVVKDMMSFGLLFTP